MPACKRPVGWCLKPLRFLMAFEEKKMLRKVAKWRRGISPLLATIILISITVSAGLVIYHFFFSTAGTASATISLEVVSVDLVKTGGKIMLSVTIKNTGSKPLQGATVTIWDDDGASHGPHNLQINGANVSSSNQVNPGAFASATFLDASIGGAGKYTVGKSYPVKIIITATDGSTLDKVVTVTCES